jgi:hypothetical protein
MKTPFTSTLSVFSVTGHLCLAAATVFAFFLTVSSSNAGDVLSGGSNSATGDLSVVAGGGGNTAGANAAAVVGGLNNSARNTAFVGGGFENSANWLAVVSGGWLNKAKTNYAVIGGGMGNTASGNSSTVAGGWTNKATGDYATLGGGAGNTASGEGATVSGGGDNIASGRGATIPGGARARARHEGSFVWSGVTNVTTVSTNARSFTVRAPGGVRFITATKHSELRGVIARPNATAWTSLSDRESKTDFQPVEPREVLAKLAAMRVTSWKYKHDPSRRYIGPTSQDFMAAFHLGDYDKGINTLDADGVTFAAIQGLVEELRERDQAIDELKAKLQAVEERLNALPPAP